jgi:hypothetical protein
LGSVGLSSLALWGGPATPTTTDQQSPRGDDLQQEYHGSTTPIHPRLTCSDGTGHHTYRTLVCKMFFPIPLYKF